MALKIVIKRNKIFGSFTSIISMSIQNNVLLKRQKVRFNYPNLSSQRLYITCCSQLIYLAMAASHFKIFKFNSLATYIQPASRRCRLPVLVTSTTILKSHGDMVLRSTTMAKFSLLISTNLVAQAFSPRRSICSGRLI